MKPEQLLAWRKAGDMSREAAAKLLGCSAITIRRYETGQSPIPEHVAAATLNMGKANTGVELVPKFERANYLTWDNPKHSPRLWRPGVGKRAGTSWERLRAGEPMLPPDTSYFDDIERVDREAHETRRKWEEEQARKKRLESLETPADPETKAPFPFTAPGDPPPARDEPDAIDPITGQPIYYEDD